MIKYPAISPDLIHLGPLRVRWYGIMYVLGFLAGRWILRRLCRKNYLRMPQDWVDDYLVYLFIGMLILARAVYMLVYYEYSAEDWHWYSPLAVWQGGLAFHGGAIGILLATYIFSKRNRVSFWSLVDAVVLGGPVGLFLGRLGNFINAELYGRETSVPWAMKFPIRGFYGNIEGWTTPRHPSQIYEAIAEGLLTLAFVWLVKQKARFQGIIAGSGICFYACARFATEFFRQKDEQMNFYFGWMTMGQVLSLIMFAVGLAVIALAYYRRVPVNAEIDEKPTAAPETA